MSEDEPSSTSPSATSSEPELHEPHSLERFLKISPVKRRRLHTKCYRLVKYNEIQSSVKKKFEDEFGPVPESDVERALRDYDSMLNKIKEKFHKEEERSKKKELLSLLPSSWTFSRIKEEFNCPRNLIQDAKKIEDDEDLEESAQTKKRPRGNQSLSEEIQQRVVEFYESEENSVQLPSAEEIEMINPDGTIRSVQKKLIVTYLRDLHKSFMEKYPTMKVGFSKFASLRPEHCVLAGSVKEWTPHYLCVTDS